MRSLHPLARLVFGNRPRSRLFLAVWICISAIAREAPAQPLASLFTSADTPSPAEEATTTMFEHPDTSPYWLSGQTNVIFQYHPAFHAAYSGPHSLTPSADNATSYVITLFGGLQVTETTEVFLDIEATGGQGLGDALGLAGFSNLDVVRNPDLSHEPYMARAMVRQIKQHRVRVAARVGREVIGAVGVDRPVHELQVTVATRPVHVEEVHESHFADANLDPACRNAGRECKGVAVLGHPLITEWNEYHDRNWAARFGEALMPTVANGINMDWHVEHLAGGKRRVGMAPRISDGT